MEESLEYPDSEITGEPTEGQSTMFSSSSCFRFLLLKSVHGISIICGCKSVMSGFDRSSQSACRMLSRSSRRSKFKSSATEVSSLSSIRAPSMSRSMGDSMVFTSVLELGNTFVSNSTGIFVLLFTDELLILLVSVVIIIFTFFKFLLSSIVFTFCVLGQRITVFVEGFTLGRVLI